MSFKLFKKYGYHGLKGTNISFSNSTVVFGVDIINKAEGVFIRFYQDDDNRKIGFQFCKNENEGFKLTHPNKDSVLMYLNNKRIAEEIQKKVKNKVYEAKWDEKNKMWTVQY